jgi:hypothetical protein
MREVALDLADSASSGLLQLASGFFIDPPALQPTPASRSSKALPSRTLPEIAPKIGRRGPAERQQSSAPAWPGLAVLRKYPRSVSWVTPVLPTPGERR